MSDETPRERLTDLLDDFNTGMLVTRATNGDLRARPMAVSEECEDATLYFATSAESAKADEIHLNPEVCVTFQSKTRYLSLSGRAELLNDRALIEKLWAPDWKIWFPEGKNDPELRVLKVDARRGEYWDLSGTGMLKFIWEAGKALVQGEEMSDLSEKEHAKVEL